MTYWIALSLAFAAAAVFMCRREFGGTNTSSNDLEAEAERCHRKLEEVDRKYRIGLLTGLEARWAATEVEVNTLAAARSTRPPAPSRSDIWRRRLAAGSVAAAVVSSIGVYSVNGSPQLPGVSSLLQAIIPASVADTVKPANAEQPAQVAPHDANDMVQGLKAKLEANPKDWNGWRMLGLSYANLGKFKEAAQAYGRALELKPDDAVVASARGEALVRAADGRVTAEALADFEKARKVRPEDPRALFFIGLEKHQRGDAKAAVADWVELLKLAPSGAPWMGELRQRIEQVAKQAGVDIDGQLAQSVMTQDVAQAEPPKGPTAEDIQNADQMSPEDRMTMIRGMVDGLDERLKQSPNDPEGWIRLIRSRLVLREPEKAQSALTRAMEAFADAPDTQARIKQAAEAMGVSAN